MGRGAIERKLRREKEAKRAEALAKGPDPQLTVRLAEVEPTHDLSHITAEAYPVEEVPKPKKRRKKKADSEG